MPNTFSMTYLSPGEYYCEIFLSDGVGGQITVGFSLLVLSGSSTSTTTTSNTTSTSSSTTSTNASTTVTNPFSGAIPGYEGIGIIVLITIGCLFISVLQKRIVYVQKKNEYIPSGID
jgi:hypothetical protein